MSDQPAITKRIVCLANSRKLHGRCLAGKELESGAWLRPVSEREHEEVSEVERRYKDGSDPRVLDVLDVSLHHQRPKKYQRENWLLDPIWYWVFQGRLPWDGLPGLADTPLTLWVNGFHTRHGLNNRIPLQKALLLESSLVLVRVESVKLRVHAPHADFGNKNRRVEAHFHYRGVSYGLRVTDPMVERRYLAQADGDYKIDETCYLTVSLSEPFEGDVYKLVAAVLTPGQFGVE